MPSIQEGIYDLGRLDQLAYRDTAVHRLDPRAKVVTTFVFLVCVISFPPHAVAPMLPFLIYPMYLTLEGGLPVRFLMRKLIAVAPFALLVGIFNPFFDREIVLFLGEIGISGGWVSFTSIMLRFFLTTFAALALIATTSFHSVCMALERLGVPDVLATQMLLLYRYIFVLGDQVMRMARARSLRSHGARGMGLAVYVNMLGHLLLRTHARAQRIYQAMLARGFDGHVRANVDLRLSIRDVGHVLGWSAAFLTFRLIDVPLYIGRLMTGALS